MSSNTSDRIGARCRIQIFSLRESDSRHKFKIAPPLRSAHAMRTHPHCVLLPSMRLNECGVIRSKAACAVNPPALVQRDHTDWLPERRLLHSTPAARCEQPSTAHPAHSQWTVLITIALLCSFRLHVFVLCVERRLMLRSCLSHQDASV